MSDLCFLNEDNFVFKGFDPTSFLKSYCKQVYSSVEDKSPSEATKVAWVVRTKDGHYKGVIRVVSASVSFFVTSTNKEPRHLIDDLYSQFSDKIAVWNRNREFPSYYTSSL
ncbi:MAG: hypothetical protein OXK80_01490 [Bdellovibrionales bacterium]|nr:hypothetical protein [Bdellovibrionales bacterium]